MQFAFSNGVFVFLFRDLSIGTWGSTFDLGAGRLTGYVVACSYTIVMETGFRTSLVAKLMILDFLLFEP